MNVRVRRSARSAAPRVQRIELQVVTRHAQLLSTGLVLVCALIFGGASRENETQTMALELLALPLLAIAIYRLTDQSIIGMRWALLLLIAAVATPLLQLMPLPPALWQALPGRDVAARVYDVAGVPSGGGITLTRETTFRSFLWLIPAVAVFLSVVTLNARDRMLLAGMVLATCVLGLTVAGLQMVDRTGDFLKFYATSHVGLPIGFFSNRNHQAILMAVATILLAAFAVQWAHGSSDRRKLVTLIYVGFVGLLVVGVLATRSRAGLALLGPALAISFAIAWTAIGLTRGRRRALLAIVGVSAVLLIILAQFALAAVLSRFEDLAAREGRFDAWPTVIEAALKVQPAGGGLGSFDTLYRASEPLHSISPFFFNHAHNDYLELWMETGIIFPILLVIFLMFVIQSAFRAWRAPVNPETILARAGSGVILVFLMHSIVDYPLRTMALACVFMFAVAVTIRAKASN